MDWQNVTGEELLNALQTVDWKAPRPLSEFFSKFGPPPKQKHLMARLKNNTYYYRANYLAIFVLSFLLLFLRNPMALLACLIITLGLLICNDPFATSLNELLLKYMRKVHPRLAQKARAKSGSDGVVGVPRRRRKAYILFFPRALVVGLLALSGLALMFYSNAWLTLAWATLLGLGLPLLHATFRLPNLKARIASAREEFRAVWRGYQAEIDQATHTL